jgi:uncharacterized metal-binding protein
MATPLRWIYGNSNRLGHLRMAASLALVTPTAGLIFAPWLFTDPSLWLFTPAAIFMHEHRATSDRDVEPSRKGGISHVYWLPYGWMFEHRSIWSHGLVVGTIGRLIYGWWFWCSWNSRICRCVFIWNNSIKRHNINCNCNYLHNDRFSYSLWMFLGYRYRRC